MKIKTLEKFASEVIGDDKSPELFFVSKQPIGIVMITRSFQAAYRYWREITNESPSVETCLEDRKFGVIASREPDGEHSKRLVIRDDSDLFARHNPKLAET